MLSYNEDNEEMLFLPRKGYLTTWEMIFCGFNSVMGLGILSIGQTMAAGIPLGLALSVIFCGLTYYSLRLYTYAAAYYHQSTFEEIWCEAFSKTTLFIPGILSISLSILIFSFYINYIQTATLDLIRGLVSSVPFFIECKYTISLIISVIFFLPICFTESAKVITIISYINLMLIVILAIYIIVRFAISVSSDGFDPNNDLTPFNKDHIAHSFTTTMFSYGILPFAWPGPRFAIAPTIKNLKKIFAMSMISSFVCYIVLGLFSYLTFFHLTVNHTIISLYPDDWYNFCANIISVLIVLFTSPSKLNNGRYIILNIIDQTNKFPRAIWCMMGISISIIAIILGNLSIQYINILVMIEHVFASISIFLFPPIMYLKGYGKNNIPNFIGSIVVLILGLFLIALSIYFNVQIYY